MNKILVALDGSPRSESVLAAALRIARASSAKLHLFRAFGLPPSLPSTYTGVTDLMEAFRKQASDYLDDVAKSVPTDRLAGKSVAVGTPWQAVCDAAALEGCEMIVIGSHGYSGWDHLLGTTAAKIVNHADRTVVVVKPVGAAPSASK